MIQVIEGQVSIFDLPVMIPKEEVKKVITAVKMTKGMKFAIELIDLFRE